MSTTKYYPNGEGTDPVYPIGTEGLEHAIAQDTALGFIANIARVLYPYAKIPAAMAVGLLDWDANAAVPTYGKWAGPGWGGGARTDKVDWAEPPCYNESVKTAANPENCYSLVDAITKTHDWNYDQAQKQYALDHDSLKYENAIMMADIKMLTSIASALVNHTYESPTGIYNADGIWTEKTYTGTFDAAETWYVAKLVPAFIAKIALWDTTIEARQALVTILTNLNTNYDGIIFNDNLCIHQNDSASKTNAWIVDLNSTAKPININILYGTDSVKASNVFELKAGNVIRINGGTKNDAIVITGANNDDIMACSFEIVGGGGLDRYYLDKDYNYKLVDSGANEIFIEDGNGGWSKIGSLYKQTNGTWKSHDSVITLVGNTLTLSTGRTVQMNDSFQSGDFGITLCTVPDNPVTSNTITGDLMPVDFDPETEGIQTQDDEWGNVIVSAQPSPGMEDALYDTTDSDLIDGGAGNDFISSSRGGDDWIKGGAGNDYITAQYHSGDMLIEGGSGQDIAYGGRGNDKIYGEDKQTGMSYYEEMTFLIAAGEIAASSEDRGDALSGGSGQIVGERQVTDGDDYLYGSNAGDVLMGGTGKDLIVGGGGNDVILGDKALSYVDRNANWSFTIDGFSISFTNLTFYAPLPDDVDYSLQEADVIYGGTGHDYISGCGGSDEIYGGDGDDTLIGDGSESGLPIEYHGDDYIDGGAGNDLIRGNGGNDLIFGGVGNDEIYGEDGDDYVEGEDGSDTLYGGNGNDFIYGGADNDTIYGHAGDDYIDGEDGDDFIHGGADHDVIFGGADHDTIYGGDGDDYLDGEAGENILHGGAGHDTVFGGEDNDHIEGDHADGDQGDDYLEGLGGDDTIIGAGGHDTIFGGEGNDQLFGDADIIPEAEHGDDYIAGEGGHDIINAHGGNNYIEGGEGNDSIWAASGNDTIYGDDGNDQISSGNGDDYIDGGEGDDLILSGAGNDTLFGGSGNDHLQGDEGDDYIDGETGNNEILGLEGNDTLRGGDGNDSIWGGIGNDSLYGGGGVDYLQGDQGNDRYYYGGNAGTVTIYNNAEDYESTHDTLEFLDGITLDDLEFFQVEGNLHIEIKGTDNSIELLNWYSVSGNQRIDYFVFADDSIMTSEEIDYLGVSGIYGSGNDDELYGSDYSDKIYGMSGNDTLYGYSGDDTLDGGHGDDFMDGGTGNDTYIFGRGSGQDSIQLGMTGSAGDVDVILLSDDIQPEDLTLTRQIEWISGDISLEHLILSIKGTNDKLTLLTYFNNIIGKGDEVIRFAASGLEWDKQTVKALMMQGTEGDDSLNGFETDDLINGYAGNDTIYGGAGNDTISGGTGNDTLRGEKGNDIYLYGTGDGKDIVYNYAEDGESVTDSIRFGDGISYSDLEIIKSANNLRISVKGTTDVITIRDHFQGKQYAIDQLIFANDDVVTSAQIEANGFFISGSDQNDSLKGASGPDLLCGYEGNDSLYGYDGADTLDGGAGNDYLNGGTGWNTYLFGRGSAIDRIDNYAPSGYSYTSTVKLGEGILPADLELSRFDDNGFQIEIKGTTDALKILYNFYGTAYINQVTKYEFYDGTIMTNEELQAMGTYTVYALGGGYTWGCAGNDHLIGNDGNNIFIGYAGDDTLDGGPGDDSLDGGRGNDVMNGGAGNDTMQGNTGNDVYIFDYGDDHDIIKADPQASMAYYSVDTDIVMLESSVNASDVTFSVTNNDLILSLAGGSDSLKIERWFSNKPVDYIQFYDGTTWDWNDVNRMLPSGTDNDDVLHGSDLSDTLQGYAGSDWIYGYEGDDVIDGGSGNDTMWGGAGNDLYHFCLGYGEDYIHDSDGSNDSIILGEGIMPADVSLLREGTDVILTINGADDVIVFNFGLYAFDSGIDTIEFQNGEQWDTEYLKLLFLKGTNGDDIISGYESPDSIDGLNGNDHISGSGGNDTLIGGLGNDALFGNLDDDLLIGGDGDDQLYGDEDNDTLFGEAGVDTLDGGSGDDHLYGGNEDDYLSGSDGMDQLNGDAGNDSLFGGYDNDSLYGGDGDDAIWGEAGDDYIDSGAGVDFLNGGEGNDRYYFGLGSGQNTVYDEGLLVDVNDTIIIGSGINPSNIMILDMASHLALYNTGSNEYVFLYNWYVDDSFRIESVQFTEVSVIWDINYLEQSAIRQGTYQSETMEGTSRRDNLYAYSGNDTLFGYDGDDYLDGGTGADMLYGGPGDDTYIVDNTGDVVTEFASEGIDTIKSSVTITLSDYVEHLTLTGSSAISATGNDLDNTLTGNSAANTITGNAGEDTLDGAGGNDALIGGSGNDTYLFGRGYGQDTIQDNDSTLGNLDKIVLAADIAPADVSLRRSGDHLLLTISGSTDTLTVQNWFLSGGAYRVEQIVFAGSSTLWDEAYILANATAGGTSGNDLLYGSSGPDHLSGLAGNDTLYGYDGDDTLDGGSGVDSMIGGNGNDSYIVDNASDKVTETTTGGTDTVLSSVTFTLPSYVEHLTLTGSNAINATGNTLNNYLIGNSAANKLTGNSGNDTLDGGAGADSLVGGTGNDLYIVDNASDKITETYSGGTDTVASSVTFTLPSYVEHLTLTGTSAINATGNTSANSLIGNSSVNTLSGSSGNDTLDGGQGDDSLNGGSGSDTYLFRIGSGQDTVNNYDTSRNRIDTVRFEDVASTELRGVRRSGNDLIIEYGATDSIAIKNHYSGTSYQINRFTFSNGVTWTSAQLLSAYPAATASQPTGMMSASSVDFRETKSLDLAVLYQATVFENGHRSTLDSLMDYMPAMKQIGYGSELGSSIRQFHDGTNRLNVSDGHYITRADIESIVNTMSSINNDAGMDVMTKYNAMMADQSYISTLSQTWKQM